MGFSYLTLSQWELILCCQEIKQLHENIWQKKNPTDLQELWSWKIVSDEEVVYLAFSFWSCQFII